MSASATWTTLSEQKARQLWDDAVEVELGVRKTIGKSKTINDYFLKNSQGEELAISVLCEGSCKDIVTCGKKVFRLGCEASERCKRTEFSLMKRDK